MDSRDREESVYSDRKREDVRLLLAASVPQGRIAKLTGLSLRTIRRIARKPGEAAQPDSGAKPRRAGPGRPSVVGPYRQVVVETLAAELRLKGPEVLRRLCERGYAGGKSALYTARGVARIGK